MRFVGADCGPATLGGIAAAAGVSRMTVSLALRNRPGVGAETRARILRLAEELGYRANPLVSAYQSHIRARRTAPYRANLAWVTDRRTHPADPGDAAHAAYWHGAQVAAAAAGFKLEAFHLPEPSRARVAALQRMLRARGIHGVLLPWVENPQLTGADWQDFSVGLIGPGSDPDAAYHSAAPDAFHNVQLAVRALRREGCARIGLTLTQREVALTRGAERAAFTFASPAPAEGLATWVQSEFHSPAGRAGLQQWLATLRPDAVLLWSAVLPLVRQLAPQARVVALDAWTELAAGGLDPQPDAVAAAGIELVVKQLQQNLQGRPPTAHTLSIRGQWRTPVASDEDTALVRSGVPAAVDFPLATRCA